MTHCPPDCACRRLVPPSPERPLPDSAFITALVGGFCAMGLNPLPSSADPQWTLLWVVSMTLLFGAASRRSTLREWRRARELATARRCSEPGCPHERAVGGSGRCLAHKQE